MSDDVENPFVDEDDDENESLMSCWKDGTRACSEECVAYEDKVEEDHRYNPCMLINMARGAKASVALIAKELKRLGDLHDVAPKHPFAGYTLEEIEIERQKMITEVKEDEKTRAQTEIAPPEIKK
jgi:hypothetical protein